MFFERSRVCLAALLMALLVALSGLAWAEDAEVSAGQIEGPAEEAGAMQLGGDETAPETPPEAVEEVLVSAPEGDDGDFGGEMSVRNKADYVPNSYDVAVSKSVSGTLYLGDVLNISFPSGLKSASSSSSKVAQITGEDLSAGVVQVRAMSAGKAKITAKTTGGKKYTVTVKVKDPYVPSEVSLGNGFQMNVGESVTLVPLLTPESARTTFKWSSSKKKVISVSGGTLTALKEGKSKITVKTANDRKATVTVSVVDPYKPDSVAFEAGGYVINVGDSVQLTAKLSPDTARTVLSWSSSKSKVAEVSADGVVTARREGSAKITVRTSNDKKATVKVKVVDQYKPTAVSLYDVTIGVNDIITLEPTLTPATARSTYSWSTSEKKVVAVNSAGQIKGIKTGTAKITVKTANGKKATCKVTVQAESVSSKRYRALLVANDDFYWGPDEGWDRGTLNRNAGIKLMNALKGVSGAEGGSISMTCKEDLDKAQLLSAIQSAFAGADDDDVSLFYFASHGDSFSTDSDAGALLMASVTEQYPEYLKLSTLRDALLAVPGRVIVMLDTCGSGAAVYAKGASADPARALARFDEAVVRAFSEADPGVALPEGDIFAKTGELMRVNKFYVLCSSRYREDSWAYNNSRGGGSMFTDWLVEGIGKSGNMPADRKYAGNGDNVADLHELYSYISNVGDNYPIEYGDTIVYQHVQVYPSNTRFEMFR